MRKEIAIHWHIFLMFVRLSLRSTMQHRSSMLLFLIGKIIRFALFFSFVQMLLSHTRVLAGYSMHESVIIFLTYTLIDSLAQMLFREVYRFRPLLIAGELDGILLKPFHPFVRILLGGIDVLDIFMVCLTGGLIAFFIQQIPSVTLGGYITYITLVINALLIATAFHICVLAMGIVSTEVDHTIMIYRDISRTGSFPVDIFPGPMRLVLTYVIPIGVMVTFPVKGLLSRISVEGIILSVIIGFVCVAGSLQFWKRALLSYQSWGG